MSINNIAQRSSFVCYETLSIKQSFRYATDKGLNDIFLYGKFEFDNDNHENKNCIYVDWCQLNGIKYTVNNVLLQDVNEDIPKYYIIDKIIIINNTNDILFKCFFLDIVYYNAHFRAYKVIQTLRSCTIAYRDLYTKENDSFRLKSSGVEQTFFINDNS